MFKLFQGKSLVIPLGQISSHIPRNLSNVLTKPRKRYIFAESSVLYAERFIETWTTNKVDPCHYINSCVHESKLQYIQDNGRELKFN